MVTRKAYIAHVTDLSIGLEFLAFFTVITTQSEVSALNLPLQDHMKNLYESTSSGPLTSDMYLKNYLNSRTEK